MLCTIPYGADGRLCPLPLPNNLTGTSCPVPAARCFAQFFGFRAGCARCPVPCTVPMGSKSAFLPRLGRKAVSRYHLKSVPAHAHRAHACPDPCNGGRPADLLSLDAVQPAARRRPNHASRRNLAPPFPRLALSVAFFLFIAGNMCNYLSTIPWGCQAFFRRKVSKIAPMHESFSRIIGRRMNPIARRTSCGGARSTHRLLPAASAAKPHRRRARAADRHTAREARPAPRRGD